MSALVNGIGRFVENLYGERVVVESEGDYTYYYCPAPELRIGVTTYLSTKVCEIHIPFGASIPATITAEVSKLHSWLCESRIFTYLSIVADLPVQMSVLLRICPFWELEGGRAGIQSNEESVRIWRCLDSSIYGNLPTSLHETAGVVNGLNEYIGK